MNAPGRREPVNQPRQPPGRGAPILSTNLGAFLPAGTERGRRRLGAKELIEKLVDSVTEGFHKEMGVVPRQFLRQFVNILDLLADQPELDAHNLLGFSPASLTVEEEAVLAGRSLEAPPADDDFAGALVDIDPDRT